MAKKDKETIEKVVKMERIEKAVTFNALPEPSAATKKFMSKMQQSKKTLRDQMLFLRQK